ncbi:hypothetical protein [Streptomyces sp. NPDC051662]|uniref:hypothetical protein n=1 Tax=Streptomyces sp. NPDC051662 TaxID=3154750 RepID=UPI00341D411E
MALPVLSAHASLTHSALIAALAVRATPTGLSSYSAFGHCSFVFTALKVMAGSSTSLLNPETTFSMGFPAAGD